MEINFWRPQQYFERIVVKYSGNSGLKKTVTRENELAGTNIHVGTFGYVLPSIQNKERNYLYISISSS